jgi:hypothetical protein
MAHAAARRRAAAEASLRTPLAAARDAATASIEAGSKPDSD